MTNELIRVLLVFMLLGDRRTATFVSELAKSQPRVWYHALLEWLTALILPAIPERATQRVALKRDRSNR